MTKSQLKGAGSFVKRKKKKQSYLLATPRRRQPIPPTRRSRLRHDYAHSPRLHTYVRMYACMSARFRAEKESSSSSQKEDNHHSPREPTRQRFTLPLRRRSQKNRWITSRSKAKCNKKTQPRYCSVFVMIGGHAGGSTEHNPRLKYDNDPSLVFWLALAPPTRADRIEIA